jgi:RNA polymerase sigma factor (TIGR02999 family)
MGEVTRLLEAARAGDSKAIDAVFELTYRELRELAHSKLQRAGKITTLDTTALVHECYLRLNGVGQLEVTDRAHFLCYAARAMRSIAVDYARKRLTQRRGGDQVRLTIQSESIEVCANEEEVVRLHDALEELAALDPRLVQVVELRYFAGLSLEEIANALDVAERTVRRDWEKARALLFGALQA